MDELTLENQLFVSSKRASAITGYAQDYIGQLCRLGRVEARRIGRAWYIHEENLRRYQANEQSKSTISEESQEDSEVKVQVMSEEAIPVDTSEIRDISIENSISDKIDESIDEIREPLLPELKKELYSRDEILPTKDSSRIVPSHHAYTFSETVESTTYHSAINPLIKIIFLVGLLIVSFLLSLILVQISRIEGGTTHTYLSISFFDLKKDFFSPF